MNICFTQKQQDYISGQIASGDFQNASEIVRDALRLHEIYPLRVIEELKAEIEKGWASASSSHSVRDIIQSKKQKTV